jgi:hypothetical protein
LRILQVMLQLVLMNGKFPAGCDVDTLSRLNNGSY